MNTVIPPISEMLCTPDCKTDLRVPSAMTQGEFGGPGAIKLFVSINGVPALAPSGYTIPLCLLPMDELTALFGGNTTMDPCCPQTNALLTSILAGIAGLQAPAELKVVLNPMCDSGTEFFRKMVFNPDGSLASTEDITPAGAPYSPAGTVISGVCGQVVAPNPAALVQTFGANLANGTFSGPDWDPTGNGASWNGTNVGGQRLLSVTVNVTNAGAAPGSINRVRVLGSSGSELWLGSKSGAYTWSANAVDGNESMSVDTAIAVVCEGDSTCEVIWTTLP